MSLLKEIWFRLLSFGFYLLYHQLAPIYDQISWLVSFGKWRSWQLASLPYVQGPDVLEIAHGPGHMLRALNQAGYRAAGVDLSPQMGQLALRKLRADAAPLSIMQARAQNLPIAPNSFDSVLTTFPTEFVAELATLEEVHRVLRDNGRFVIVPQAQLTGGSAAVRLLEGLYRITGQRNLPGAADEQRQTIEIFHSFHDQFNRAGFDLRTEHVLQADSKVIVLIAAKQAVFS